MKKISTPRDLLVEELKDLYSAETQLIKALPKMAEAASSDDLRAAFETHLEQTQGHVDRLQKIGVQLGEAMSGKKCKAMAGLVAEGADVIGEDAEPAMRDLALIGAAQKVEHYEIAGYGTTRTLAELAGEEDIAGILQETLDEEGETDKLLTKIAADMEWGAEDDEADHEDEPVGAAVGKGTGAPLSGTGGETKSRRSAAATAPVERVGAGTDAGQATLVAGPGKKRARG
jgi:ferritin-like metal-binding protein YciE